MIDDEAGSFRFAYEAGTIGYGRGRVADLAAELDRRGIERALVVTGSTVGATPAVMEPIRAGLGDRLAGVFAETTPEKRLATAHDAAEALRAAEADGLVAVGGGSSLDVAKVASVLAAATRSPEAVGRDLAESGRIPVPEGSLPPIVAIPTTLAGADLSIVAGVTADPASGLVDEPVAGGVSDPRLMPAVLCYDPDLFATTPRDVLAASAMNGFDKGIETPYARTATPITDATATRGLSLLRSGLPDLDSDAGLERSIVGTILVQYGIARPEGTTLSLLHAFGHGLRDRADCHQGVAHAIVAPHALRYLFEQVDGRRDLLADALDADADGDVGEAVVEEVIAVRDALGLPSRLGSIDGLRREDLDAVAEAVLDDGLLTNAPAGFEATREGVRGVLREAW